jgi:glycosyltransferase involved in cell wall biosynthesis
MRIAWFSPVPPDRSGIAAYTTELIPHLSPKVGSVDLYHAGRHDFVWRHRRAPYDLTVYQLGNSDSHDFMWAYLFRYPGLLVLHDAQVHQARALWLLRRLEPRLDDYLVELAANHPEAPPALGHLFAAGLGGQLFRLWPLVSLAIRASRLTAVHNAHLARRLAREHPGAVIRHLDMGVADPGTVPDDTPAQGTVPPVRGRHGIPTDACVIGAFGGITPEKRIPQLLEAVAASRHVKLHVLLVGSRAAHYDVEADVRRHGLEPRVHLTGFVADEELPTYLHACDICWCLRWPSNGETSASWLRCLAAGRPTLITALAQLQDVPTLSVNAEGVAPVSTNEDAIAIAIDPLDERRDLGHALDALARDPGLRRTLGANARSRWTGLHTLSRMADAYAHVIDEARCLRAPMPDLPAHLIDDGGGTARRLLSSAGVPELPW